VTEGRHDELVEQPVGPDDPHTLPVDAAGVDEVGVAPWPILLRQRIARRVGIDRRWAILIVVLSGLFTVAFTITLLAVSLQRIATDLDSDIATVSWTITGPMLAFGVVGPAYGKAGDLWGHKRVFLLGLLGAGIFAALTAVAWSATSLIAFRVLSSTAGAATGPSTMAFVNRLFPPDERVKPLGYWTFVSAGAPVLGVVAGAPLVEAFGWRVIFVIQAPLCLAGVLVGLWLLPDTERRDNVRFDIAGSLALGLGAASVLAAISQGARWGWTSPLMIGVLTAGALLLVAFVRVERRVAEPLMPLHWLRTRNVAVPVGVQSLANFAYMGGFLLAPQVLTRLLDYSTSRTGLVVIARPLTFAVVAPLAGYLTMRIGERRSAVGGTALVACSMVGFVFVEPDSGALLIVVALALSGAGFGLAGPALTSLVANAVDDADLGVAGALQQLITQLGAVLGSVVMTSVQQASEQRSGLDGSFRPAFAVAAVVAATATVLATFVRSTPRQSAIRR
jgi:EmrB/QacA subfamily drug resistance transporter